MDVIEIFKDSLEYPLSNPNKLIIMGVLFILCLVAGFFSGILDMMSIKHSLNSSLIWNITYLKVISIIGFIIALIASFVLYGYSTSIIKSTVEGIRQLPEILWFENLIGGIKLYVVVIVYLLVPTIISLVISIFLGSFTFIIQVIYNTLFTIATSHVPNPITITGGPYLGLVVLTWNILLIISLFFILISIVRLSKTDSIKEALNFKELITDLSNIGVGNYIILLILYLVIMIVLSFIFGIIAIIPFIGIIMFALILAPYLIFFSARTFGLIYKEVEN